MTEPRRPLDLRAVALGLCALYLVGWENICLRYGVDVPFMDQWGRPLMQIYKMLTGAPLSFFGDLWPQHNEGRKVVPTLVSMALARALGHYDVHAELAVGLALWAAVAYAVARLARAARMEPPAGAVLALVYLSVAGSSRTSYFHLYSITFERLIPELGLVASLALLTSRGLGWGSAALTAAVLCVGQYSYPGALACWLLVPAFALVACRPRLGPFLLLAGCGALSSYAYFRSYQTPPNSTPLAAALAQPIGEWLRFFLGFLGNPLGAGPGASIGAAATLLVLVPLSWLALRRAPRAALAWTALAAYSLSQALMATVTRLPMGMAHATRGDYVMHAVFLYVATAALLLLVWPRRAVAAALVLASLLPLAGMLRRDVRADLRGNRDLKLAARHCLTGEEPGRCDPSNFYLQPDANALRAFGEEVRRRGVWGL